MARHNVKGQQAEQLACDHLKARGLRLIKRNFNVPQGEIDLIMRDGDTLVFVEVRYRSRRDFGSGAESINWRKRQRLANAAARYLQAHPGQANRPSRFDVVSIDHPDGERPEIQWIQNAFLAE